MALRLIHTVTICVGLLVSSGVAMAQSAMPIRVGSVLVIDQQSLLTKSVLGMAILELEQSEQAALVETGSRITAEFEAEELFLTQQREVLEPAEFRVLADAFDAKVEVARTEQSANDAAQVTRSENRRRNFYQIVIPQLAEIMLRHQAAAIVDRRTVLLFDTNLDITQEAIDLLDQAYADDPGMIDLNN